MQDCSHIVREKRDQGVRMAKQEELTLYKSWYYSIHELHRESEKVRVVAPCFFSGGGGGRFSKRSATLSQDALVRCTVARVFLADSASPSSFSRVHVLFVLQK